LRLIPQPRSSATAKSGPRSGFWNSFLGSANAPTAEQVAALVKLNGFNFNQFVALLDAIASGSPAAIVAAIIALFTPTSKHDQETIACLNSKTPAEREKLFQEKPELRAIFNEGFDHGAKVKADGKHAEPVKVAEPVKYADRQGLQEVVNPGFM
jgi:hypothetical protein